MYTSACSLKHTHTKHAKKEEREDTKRTASNTLMYIELRGHSFLPAGAKHRNLKKKNRKDT